MVFNPDKFHFMVLDDSNCNCNFACNGKTIECSNEEKVLGLTLDHNLNFTSHLGNIIKKTNQKFHTLSRVKCYMGFEQNKLIFSSFVKSQFNYCPLIWIFYSRTFINKLKNIHEKYLRLITNNFVSNVKKLLESSHRLSIHKICINYFMIEVLK